MEQVIRPAPSFGKLDFRGGPTIRGYRNAKRREQRRNGKKGEVPRGREARVARTPRTTLRYRRAG